MTEETNNDGRPDPYQFRILAALNNTRHHIYAGTVSAKEKASRRAKTKRQKASRRKNW